MKILETLSMYLMISAPSSLFFLFMVNVVRESERVGSGLPMWSDWNVLSVYGTPTLLVITMVCVMLLNTLIKVLKIIFS